MADERFCWLKITCKVQRHEASASLLYAMSVDGNLVA